MNIDTMQGLTFTDIFNIQRGTNSIRGTDKLKQDLTILLLQERGKFYPDPNFGSELYHYVFEPADIVTERTVKEEIKSTIEKYYPELNLLEIHADFNTDTKAISLEIIYSYSNTGQDTNSINLELFYSMD